MCIFRKRRKEIDKKFEEINKNIKFLTDFLTTNEYNKLKEQSEKFKDTKKLLKQVHFDVKNAQYYEDDTGAKHFKVSYNIPPIVMEVDENYNVSRNEMFRAINMLNLIDMDSFKKIQKELDKIGKEKKRNGI